MLLAASCWLIYSIASNDETIDHIEELWQTGSLKNKERYDSIHLKCDNFGRKINAFIKRFENEFI